MVDLVDVTAIEKVVGVERWTTEHVARYETRTKTLFILHSWECLRTTHDLRDCRYAEAQEDMLRERHDWALAPWVWNLWLESGDQPHLVELGTYGKREGKGVPWYYLKPMARLPRTFVPAYDSIARRNLA